MKGTEHFKQTIKAFLDNKAASDELFAQSYHKPHKNIDDCVTYVLNWVQSTGSPVFLMMRFMVSVFIFLMKTTST